MLRPECLNPRDVLAHLNSLGYHNITTKQLKDFLHDLKKLIKYDQKQALQNINLQHSESEYCNSQYDTSEKLSSDEYLDDSNSVCSTSAIYNRAKDLKMNEIKKRSSNNPTDSEIAQKAQISFIRPWNLQGYKDLSSRGKKNLDPVQLYHQYRELWTRQGIPGESKHSDLRWVIRNRMLGQEPNPRVYVARMSKNQETEHLVSLFLKMKIKFFSPNWYLRQIYSGASMLCNTEFLRALLFEDFPFWKDGVLLSDHCELVYLYSAHRLNCVNPETNLTPQTRQNF